MKAQEAAQILCVAKWAMIDMGMALEAGETEDAELFLRRNPTPQEAHEYASFVLPKGRKGRAKLAICEPEQARAFALVAAVLRSVE